MELLISGVRAQWNLANTLTLFRVFSIGIAAACIFFGWVEALFYVMLAAILSDAEGTLARATNTTTELGRVFDPLADKLFTNAMLFAYVIMYGDAWALLLFLVTLGYDIDNTNRRFGDILEACRNSKRKRESAPTTLLSKLKTCILYAVLLVFYLPLEWFAFDEPELAFLAIFATCAVLATWAYNRRDWLQKI